MEHFLTMQQLSEAELYDLLDLASRLKYENRNGISHRRLEGKTLGMIFAKSSTRTRVSFETGMYQLGGHPLFLSSRDLQLGRGEPIRDTARVLSRYLDCVMIRTYDHSDVEEFASVGSIPVINALTDYAHPCQVLADLLTIREARGDLTGRKLCFIGDGNNMANSLITGCLIAGMSVAIGCPDGYRPDPTVIEFANKYPGKLLITSDIYAAAEDSDAIYTDVWASMGQEEEAEQRKQVFAGYQVNAKLMEVAKPDAMVLHCLPAHRGEEITDDVFEKHADEIFEEAENRLHAQKAVMLRLMEK